MRTRVGQSPIYSEALRKMPNIKHLKINLKLKNKQVKVKKIFIILFLLNS